MSAGIPSTSSCQCGRLIQPPRSVEAAQRLTGNNQIIKTCAGYRLTPDFEKLEEDLKTTVF